MDPIQPFLYSGLTTTCLLQPKRFADLARVKGNALPYEYPIAALKLLSRF